MTPNSRALQSWHGMAVYRRHEPITLSVLQSIVDHKHVVVRWNTNNKYTPGRININKNRNVRKSTEIKSNSRITKSEKYKWNKSGWQNETQLSQRLPNILSKVTYCYCGKIQEYQNDRKMNQEQQPKSLQVMEKRLKNIQNKNKLKSDERRHSMPTFSALELNSGEDQNRKREDDIPEDIKKFIQDISCSTDKNKKQASHTRNTVSGNKLIK